MKFGDSFWRDAQEKLANKYEPEHLHSFANIYWHALLLIAFVASTAVFVYGTRILMQILSDLNAPPSVSKSAPPVLDRSILNATVRGFEERKAQFNDIRTNPTAGVQDPSI